MKSYSVLRSIIIIYVCFMISPVCNAIEMTGVNTVPPSPATLQVNDSFSCKEDGNALLKYDDGTSISFESGSQGMVTIDGLKIKEGRIWVAYRKKGGKFVISTPPAIIGIRGTDFGLMVKSDELQITLVNGSVEITPSNTSQKPVVLKPGHVLTIANGVVETRKSSAEDLIKWQKFITGTKPLPEKPQRMPSFAEQYLYSMMTLNSGVIMITDSDGVQTPVSKSGSVIKTGSRIETSAGSTAKLSLLCGSVIKLPASSLIKLGKTSLSLIKGACLVRHVGKGSPLKIEGITPVRISKDSVVSIELVDNSFLMRVEKGSAFLPELKHSVSAGECVKATKTVVTKASSVPRSWDEPVADISLKKPAKEPDDSAFGTEIEAGDTTSSSNPGENTASASDDLANFQSILGL